MTVIASAVLANGLRTEFADTYSKIRNRQADGRLGKVMDLGVGATNRQHEFAYFNAAPHMEYWRRGESIPQDDFDSVSFTAYVYEWAKRIPWSKWDRKDDQIQGLMDSARAAGESAALLPERFFFDLLANSASTLPGIPLAPDGAAFFATSDTTGAARFGATSGNLITGGGVASTAAILTDYYKGVAQFKAFQDGKGQPMFIADQVDQGFTIIYSSADEEVFDQAFLQKRQGTVLGVDAGTTPSNIVQDASRTVQLWSSSRLATGDWFMFMNASPKLPTFLLNREGLQEFSSLEGDNNGDLTRTTGEEYIQWETREGAGIALPYGAVKINN